MNDRMIVLGRREELGSAVPALREVLLKEEVSETLANILFQVIKYLKGTATGVIRIPEIEANRVFAEIRRELVLILEDDDHPLTEIYEKLYKMIGEAAPRR